MLIILSPLLLLIAIIVRLDSKGEILFKQKRIGKNSKIFIYISLELCLIIPIEAYLVMN